MQNLSRGRVGEGVQPSEAAEGGPRIGVPSPQWRSAFSVSLQLSPWQEQFQNVLSTVLLTSEPPAWTLQALVVVLRLPFIPEQSGVRTLVCYAFTSIITKASTFRQLLASVFQPWVESQAAGTVKSKMPRRPRTAHSVF